MSHPPARIALLAYPGCDLLDLGGPYEVFITANRLAARASKPEPFALSVATPDGGATTVLGGLGVVPHGRASDLPALAALVVPGAVAIDQALRDRDLVAAVTELAARSDRVASVCTGAFLLAEAGLLVDRVATTHHEDRGTLAARPDVGQVLGDARVVDAGTVLTAGALTCGIDLGLRLVALLAEVDLAVAVAANLAHPWEPGAHALAGLERQPHPGPGGAL